MLKKEMVNKLNEQLNLESFSANLYLQMSAWCEDKSYSNIARFLLAHAKEEQEHMQRLFDYISDTGAMPIIGMIEAPEHQYKSVTELFKKAYQHELLISEKINQLVHYSLTSQDYPTFNFLQWYVAEQHEEEKLFKTVLDKIERVEANPAAMFLMDKDFSQVISQSSGQDSSTTA